jgi:hypothetical protein
VLKKLTAAGILAATATGVMLTAVPANADLLSARPAAAPATYPVGCYQPGLVYQPAWCTTTPSITVYPGVPAYPTYGWRHWHHHYWPGQVYFRR